MTVPMWAIYVNAGVLSAYLGCIVLMLIERAKMRETLAIAIDVAWRKQIDVEAEVERRVRLSIDCLRADDEITIRALKARVRELEANE